MFFGFFYDEKIEIVNNSNTWESEMDSSDLNFQKSMNLSNPNTTFKVETITFFLGQAFNFRKSIRSGKIFITNFSSQTTKKCFIQFFLY